MTDKFARVDVDDRGKVHVLATLTGCRFGVVGTAIPRTWFRVLGTGVPCSRYSVGFLSQLMLEGRRLAVPVSAAILAREEETSGTKPRTLQ